jgi:hypothetical protein
MICLFALLSPLDVYSHSARLSWVAYAFICLFLSGQSMQNTTKVSFFRRALRALRSWLFANIKLQMLFSVMSLIMIGEISLLAFVGNLLFLPVLTLFLQSVLFIRIILSEAIYLKFCGLLDYLIDVIREFFAPIFTLFPVIITSYVIPFWLRACFDLLFCFFLLKSLSVLPILEVCGIALPRNRLPKQRNSWKIG